MVKGQESFVARQMIWYQAMVPCHVRAEGLKKQLINVEFKAQFDVTTVDAGTMLHAGSSAAVACNPASATARSRERERQKK